MQKVQQYIQTQNRGNVCLEHDKGQVSSHNECKNATIHTTSKYKNTINKHKLPPKLSIGVDKNLSELIAHKVDNGS